jgi:hypothetical protein
LTKFFPAADYLGRTQLIGVPDTDPVFFNAELDKVL